ncbi:hypothetical protein MMC22_009647 [Lobaria immixta]|nr:hypothetical protein [Lobaria immixta]
MALSSSREYYITSSADAAIAKHPFPIGKGIWNTELKPIKISQTKHSGQQGLRIRSDGKIFSTAGWDARIRIYSAKTMNELAVLRWHKPGCCTTAFAQTDVVMPARVNQESNSKMDQDEVGKRASLSKAPQSPVFNRDETIWSGPHTGSRQGQKMASLTLVYLLTAFDSNSSKIKFTSNSYMLLHLCLHPFPSVLRNPQWNLRL